MVNRRSFLQLGTTASFGLSVTYPLLSQSKWPAKPIKWVVPFAPGGGADIIARLAAMAIGNGLPGQLLIENRGGASGTIGGDAVAKSADDGYTWLMSNNASIATAPVVYPRVAYHPINDFVHVFMIGSFANALLVRADHPAKSLADFLQMAKRRPGSLSFASAGPGSAGHLTGELLKIKAGVDMQHVPYRGTGPAIVDLVSGQIDALFDGLPASIGYISSGKLRALAVSAQDRLPNLPNIPTLAETVGSVFASAWFGVSVPAKTPAEIVKQIESAGRAALENRELRLRLIDIGVVPSGQGSATYTAFIRSEIARWTPVIKQANIRGE